MTSRENIKKILTKIFELTGAVSVPVEFVSDTTSVLTAFVFSSELIFK